MLENHHFNCRLHLGGVTDTVPNAINGEGQQIVPLQNIPIFSIKSCPELNSNVEATSLQDISTNEKEQRI